MSVIKKVTGKTFKDPSSGKKTCLSADGTTQQYCEYQYTQCSNGAGYILTVALENQKSIPSYVLDSLVSNRTAPAVLSDHKYELGKCDSSNADTTLATAAYTAQTTGATSAATTGFVILK